MPMLGSSASSSDESEPILSIENAVAGSSRPKDKAVPMDASNRGPDVDSDSDSDSDYTSDADVYIAPSTRRAYLVHLSSHITTTANPEHPLEPSLFLPVSYWSSSEKDSFFRALNVHSRLRPDLIAAAVRSKSATEVSAYIDALEKALDECRWSSSSKGKGKEKALYTPLSRNEFPAVYEVSDAWVEREGRIARAIITEERRMSADAIDRSREEEIRSMRKSVRARKRRKLVDGDRDQDRDREGEKIRRAHFEEWLAQRRAEWEVRDAIDALDGTMLKAMDMLLREQEEAHSSLQSEDLSPATGSNELLYETREEATSSPDATSQPHPGAQVPLIDDSLIDPVLRGLSVQPQSTDHPPPSQSKPLPSSYNNLDLFNPVTPPFPSAPLPVTATPYLAPVIPEPPGPEPETEYQGIFYSSVDPERQLSPTSRRRLVKRLYMRRKRAAARGDTPDMRNVRLRPGRKPKPRPVGKSEDKGSAAVNEGDGIGSESEADEDIQDGDKEGHMRHPRPSGKTLPYKIREQLSSLGIGVEWLQQEGLDFFHLSAVHKLMKTYSSLENAAPGVSCQISADALRLLLAHVVYFTTRLVRQVIVSREQEMVAKMHTKVWRLASNQVITVSNVEHALMLLGVDVTNKKTHFQCWLDRLDPQGDEGHEGSDDHEDEADDEDEDEENEDAGENARSHNPQDPLSTVPLHRQIFPPFIKLPSSLRSEHTDPSAQSLLTYIPWARTAPSAGDEEDLLASETDEEALGEEIEEEEKLDELDRMQDASHERSLWAKFGEEAATQTHPGKRKRGDDETDGEDFDEMESDYLDEDAPFADDPMRYRPPGGKIKSAAYIDDSD
ncbi:hypothetical protein EIP86_010082 [Pleurotus ostreatoroseus]|nr:hypothetical protein EIP86_010082 [Pleurotus ostreatoroseus]